MKKNMKYFVMAVVALLSMSACNNELDEQVPAAKGNVVSFQMGLVNTKTTTSTDYITTFVKGDAVGIFAYERNTDGTDGTLAVTNAKYVLNADGATWTAADAQNAAYADANTAFNYYAYYPYQEGITDPTTINMAVKLDQSTAAAADYNLSDALTAQNKTVEKNSTNVTLAFKHAFALVQVNLDGLAADKDAIVTLQNVYPQATLNLLTQVVDNANGTNGSIKMYSLPEINQVEKANRFAFRAIVPAQSITAGTTLAEIQSKGKTYRFTYSTNVDYVASKLRVMNITLGGAPEKNTITIPASNMAVDKWGTTEEGSGSGSVEEVPVTSIIPQIEVGMPFTMKGIFSAEKVTDANTYWFHRENTTSATTVTVEETEGLAIALTVGATKGAWNNSCIGYHFYGKLERATYKMTLSMKSNITGGIVGITVAGSKDDKMFKMLNDQLADWSRNVTTYGSLNSTWLTKTLYLDFTNANVDGRSSGLTSYTATTNEDVEGGINIMLYNYTGMASTVYIKDIKVEKFTPAE